ncbi:very low-density lipoprotein receptor-like isoform X2 [Dendronephthya gigantea]|uniref:very low-density lipoprotein receptor-like isoform X2 n=1 Tax=Dendronephthya gigantea TaxID=151771 RepID=UPI00106953F0|nr:very low-density lipoprotein receptor-like isoform X2 [Dendronephthya gigantea]
MLLMSSRSKRPCVLLHIFFVISVVCQWSTKADDYECKTDEVKFKCQGDGKCIPKNWECDREDDCLDGSDEKNCDVCGENEFSCNGTCISRQWVCDGVPDCKDKIDESPEVCANVSCEFKCHKSKDCILKSWVCDHDLDCADGSDEKNCSVNPCPSNRFQCTNNKCIDINWKCDHDNDCGDNSDEKGCSFRECDTRFEWKCKNERCILKEALCDNHYDCDDNSDESPNCTLTTKHIRKCPGDRFLCKDGSCLPNEWVCDGDVDCPFEDDEFNCKTCPDGQISCKSERNQCIPKSFKCNGKQDCDNGSDENNCDSTCKENEFECEKTKKCLPDSLVCNNQNDCGDNTDEGKLCDVNECSKNNGGCQHRCEDKKIGYRCLCKAGYKVGDDEKTCQKINVCEEFGKCSQICEPLQGDRYKCSCVAGYHLETKDHRTCKARERQPYLVFSDHYSIRKLMLHNSEFFGIVPHLAGTIAVDYHFGEDLMYWTDGKNTSIQRTTLNGDTKIRKETIITDVKAPDGIAVDWVTGKLYWTDAWKKTIEVASLRGEHRRALITTDIDMPRAIVLHPNFGEMFWTDWGKNPKIEKCGMNGDPASRRAIITTRILWPNALTIDYTIDSIWWVDAKLDLIEHCDLNGSNRRVILAERIFHPFSISVFEDNVYWSDWYKTAIYKANKFTGKNVTVLREGLVHTMGISMIHPQRQPASFNFCQDSNGGCSHLCLLSAQRRKSQRYTCACPEGMFLLADNKSCNVSGYTCKKGGCNNGTCVFQHFARGPHCVCKEGYSGVRCENEIKESIIGKTNKNLSNAVTIGISVGVVAMIFIIFGMVGFIFYKRIQKRHNAGLTFANPVYTPTTKPLDEYDGGMVKLFGFLEKTRKKPQKTYVRFKDQTS